MKILEIAVTGLFFFLAIIIDGTRLLANTLYRAFLFLKVSPREFLGWFFFILAIAILADFTLFILADSIPEVLSALYIMAMFLLPLLIGFILIFYRG
jgi:hypothetical protein